MVQTAERTARRSYVRVTSEFDQTGYMQPRSIIWKDGRTFPIDEVKSFRAVTNNQAGRSCDCYTVVIRGEVRFLFFERCPPQFACQFGRWFVEQSEA